MPHRKPGSYHCRAFLFSMRKHLFKTGRLIRKCRHFTHPGIKCCTIKSKSATLLRILRKTEPVASMSEKTLISVGCPTERAIVRALLYFDIFSYPLTAAEVFQYSNCPNASGEDVAKKLQELVKKRIVHQFGPFYQIPDSTFWVSRRLDANRRADRLLPVAKRMARLIGCFPFIRGVFVSGSLSKHSMRADSDIDFFLITEPGRLWFARTLLVIFKKIFLFNSRKYFCVNYFIDTKHLEIEEKNLFTATEIATLLPLYGREWYEAFYQANDWIRDFFPHFPKRSISETPPDKRNFVKKTAEKIFGSPLCDRLDRGAMRFTIRFWRYKFRHFDEKTFDGALKSRQYVSKHHPLYFQQSVLEQYARRVSDWERPE